MRTGGITISHTNPNSRFDYRSWFDRQVARRTEEALAARDAAFAARYETAPNAVLVQYLRFCADTLCHTPAPEEIDGSPLLMQRFGSWEEAVRAAGLRHAPPEMKLSQTARYHRERKVQAPLFFAESEANKRAKREKARAAPSEK